MSKRQTPIELRIPDCGVLMAESFHGRGFSMNDDRHEFHELYYIFRGSLRYFEERLGEAVYLTEGSFMPINSGVFHRIEDLSEVTLLILAFSESFIDKNSYRAQLWEHLQQRSPKALRPDTLDRDRLERCLQVVLAEQANPQIGSESLIRAEATQALVILGRLPQSCLEANSYTRVESIIRAVKESYYEEWSVDEAARRAHLSRRRFTMIFRELTGMSLLEYRNDLRLEQAARLIRDHGNTIAGAAFSSGFQDLAHFYRLFKRKYGQPPGKWAAQASGE